MVSGVGIDALVCHLTLAAGYRGGERQTELLIRALAGRGYSQRLVVKKGHTLTTRCADVENLEVREVASNPVAVGLATRGSRIVHAHDGRTVYSALLANLLFGIPYLITRRVVPKQRKSALRTLAYRRAAKVVALSQAVVDALHYRDPWLETAVIPSANSGFASHKQAVAAIRAKRPGKVLIGNVGALDDTHKGQSTIIDAAHIVAERHPEWQFLICGSGRDEQRYREQIGRLKNIELVGWVDNVGDYLDAFDLFVYPSRHEALGSALLDALQFGLPIIASNVGGIPEIVKDGENGRLIEPGDAEQLVSAMRDLLGSPPELDAMRERNSTRAMEFSVGRMADAYESLYELAREPCES